MILKRIMGAIAFGMVSGWCFAQQPPLPPVSPPVAESPVPGSQPPPLTEDNINQQTRILRDPGMALDNAKQVLLGQAPADTQAAPITLDTHGKRIADPTQMTGSFTQALSRIKPGQGVAAAAPALPLISLVAKAISHANKKSAMLNVANNVRMVREGSKFSFIENNQLYEVQVNKIDSDHVDITLLPMGRQMILQ